jgi:hypothetical protein
MSEPRRSQETLHRVQFTFDGQVVDAFGRLALVRLADTAGNREMVYALVEVDEGGSPPAGSYVRVAGPGHFVASGGLWQQWEPGGPAGPVVCWVLAQRVAHIAPPEPPGGEELLRPCSVATSCRAMTAPVWCDGHLVDPARPAFGFLGRG